LTKFDARSDEAIFLGYALDSKAYRVFNKRTNSLEESINVVFDEIDAGKTGEQAFTELRLTRNEDDPEPVKKQSQATEPNQIGRAHV